MRAAAAVAVSECVRADSISVVPSDVNRAVDATVHEAVPYNS